MKKYLLCICITFLLPLLSYSQINYEATEQLNLRDSTSSKSKLKFIIPNGGVVGVVEQYENGWWLINYKGYEGFVLAKYLTKHYVSGDEPECSNISKQADESIDNYLRINVGINTDVAVKLMRQNSYMETCIRAVYIRAGESFEIRNIPQGQYYLKIAYGKNFRQFTENGQCIMRFAQNALYEKGADILNYEKVKLPNKYINGEEYENWSIPSFELKLDVVIINSKGKSFKSSNISEKEFNK